LFDPSYSGFLTAAGYAPLTTSNPVFASGSKRVLALTLLVLGGFANHPHYTLAVDDFALVANFLDRCSYFHKTSSQFSAVSSQELQLQIPRFARENI
jgi:hypothetical protein